MTDNNGLINPRCYPVLEAPVMKNSIRMDLIELERFCDEYEQPLFYLRVGEITHTGVPLQVKPFMRFFTFVKDIMIFAEENIKETHS